MICPAAAQIIDNHPAKYSSEGALQPWGSFGEILDREMAYYMRCPIENGYQETGENRYLDTAVHTAEVLAKNMEAGDQNIPHGRFALTIVLAKAEEPFSVDMSFLLRLFDKMIELKHDEFVIPRTQLWKWILDFQILCIEHGKKVKGNCGFNSSRTTRIQPTETPGRL